MSFRDFNDEGPGTYAWDYVLGGNTTGLFPEKHYYEVDGDTLLEVICRHTGGNRYEPVYGDSYAISNVSEVHRDAGRDWFTFEQAGRTYKAVINGEISRKTGLLIVDLEEM